MKTLFMIFYQQQYIITEKRYITCKIFYLLIFTDLPCKSPMQRTIDLFFTITAEIYARALVDFYGQYADRRMNLKFMRRVSERDREIRQFVS